MRPHVASSVVLLNWRQCETHRSGLPVDNSSRFAINEETAFSPDSPGNKGDGTAATRGVQELEHLAEGKHQLAEARERGGVSLDFYSGATNAQPSPSNRGIVIYQPWNFFRTSAWLRAACSHRGRQLESGKQRFRLECVPTCADEDWFLLAKPIHAEDGLHLTCGVPSGVHEYHTVGAHKIGAQ
ncbi:hypothetical protein HPB50_028818 [Hyalomma asiaticum]|nr:hypothetical protein HPB50_028818 [Hyalomma asiaticum]